MIESSITRHKFVLEIENYCSGPCECARVNIPDSKRTLSFLCTPFHGTYTVGSALCISGIVVMRRVDQNCTEREKKRIDIKMHDEQGEDDVLLSELIRKVRKVAKR